MIVYVEKCNNDYLVSSIDGEYHCKLKFPDISEMLSEEQWNIFSIRGFKGYFEVKDCFLGEGNV